MQHRLSELYTNKKRKAMKKILFVAAMMLASVGAFAQHAVGTFTLQPRVGMNVAMLTDADNNDPRIGFVGGAELEYQISDIFSVSGGLLYSMQGSKYDYDNVEGGGDLTNKLDYLNIPIMANVYVVKGLAVKLGAQFGFCVNDKVKYSDNKYMHGDFDADAKTFDFTIPVGLSYEFSGVPIVIDARYNWGLTKIWDNSDSKNSVFQFTLGYKFEL